MPRAIHTRNPSDQAKLPHPADPNTKKIALVGRTDTLDRKANLWQKISRFGTVR